AREIGRAIANMPAGVREPLGKRFMLFRQIHSTQVSRLAVDDTLRQANGTSRLFIHEHARHPNKRFEVDLLQGGGVALDIHQPHGLVKRADKEADHAALTENLVDTWINVDTRIVFGPAMDAQMIQNNIN
ncbi:MAG: hypothetical protein KDA80_14935, partial [Planctomycetaceae bacterium]|nr:hypothetical protein [Planctomycetaceae bacterium]